MHDRRHRMSGGLSEHSARVKPELLSASRSVVRLRVLPEQIRQLGEIDGHAARLVARHAVHRSTAARLVLAVEPTNRATACIVNTIATRNFDYDPGDRKAAWRR